MAGSPGLLAIKNQILRPKNSSVRKAELLEAVESFLDDI